MKMNSRPRHEEDTLIARHAADWLRRLQSEDAGERAAFLVWVKQSPLHVREMLLAIAVDDALDGMDSQRRIDLGALLASVSRNVVPLRAKTPSVEPVSDRLQRKRWSRVAGVAAGLVLLGALGLTLSALLRGAQYATTLGEQRAVLLADGSVVHLNTLSRVREDFSAGSRDIYLLEGQAIFRVAHDAARPFRVHTDTAVIQAIGTQFDVRLVHGGTAVAVIEGVVQVSPAAEQAQQTASTQNLAAGQATEVQSKAGPIAPPHATDVKDITAWQQRRLVFRKDTLADIASEFNRYGRVKMLVEGQDVRARRFSGTFDADDPTLLLGFLDRDASVTVERHGGEIQIRPRAQ